ncbi:MAG: excinuclease ABC subunit UvrA [Bacteroidales bacterium]|jgi:excinuclease ABC subunit A|nr:excinuclease ABC subunit UvrA [Bacteroidales bacterium]
MKSLETNAENSIIVEGARENNLKNISVTIPRNALTVITGLSGSGKSSLAFDTIYAEGQRRYIETLSAYARQFLGNLERPDVDKITGLSPVISIEQKTVNKNPRSTVGTTTEIYDFLRLLYSRIGEAYSYNTGEKMVKYTTQKIIDLIVEQFQNKKIMLLAPVVKGRKGHYQDLFEQYRKKGYLYARIDGVVKELTFGMKVDRYKIHDIEIVIDKFNIQNHDEPRLKQSIETAMKIGKNICMILDVESETVQFFSKKLMCPTTGLSYNEPAPHSFSFNSPHGACPTCGGLGEIDEIDIHKIIPDTALSIQQGCIKPLGAYKKNLIFCKLEAIAHKHNFSLKTPFCEIPEEAKQVVLFGSNEMFSFITAPIGVDSNYFYGFEGIIALVEKQLEFQETPINEQSEDYLFKKIECPDCCGMRLNKESLHFKLAHKNIAEVAQLSIDDLYTWIADLPRYLDKHQKQIGVEILKEIQTRIGFLLDVGLHYLSLNRSSRTLSGGESQRIRLATQIGSKLVNVLYILDEPSIGLHQRDNVQLIDALKNLRDAGNSVIVVEHDKDMMLNADYIIDIGPGAGRHGGEIVAQGTPDEFFKQESITADYILNRKQIAISAKRRKGNGKTLTLVGATGNNLKNVTLNIPLGMLVCITGVSGSGKSSLINNTLHPILSKHFYHAKREPLPYKKITGIEHINKVIEVNQTPLGRTPRSNPVTYTNIFSDIRKLFERLPESQVRNYKAGRFSFNIKGGRCETCKGAGVKTIEMNFLPDVYVPCDTCGGKRYNRETLEVKYKGKSISDVLDLTINQGVEFFEAIPDIYSKLKTLQNVGLGYLTLGQSSTTLSGGEAQRVKLAAELAKRDSGNTLYILDEPTTGLHFQDIAVFMNVIQQLVDKGNSVIIIEHNLDVIKVADWIIDIGPDGGKNGGTIVAEGTPETVSKLNKGYTAKFIAEELHNSMKI